MKSDNIEELFREAAEKYEIDTEKAEAWNDVHDAVHADDAQLKPPPEDKRKRRWLMLGWLLLIPLGWFAHYAYNNMNGAQNIDKKGTYNNTTANQKTPTENSKPENNAANTARIQTPAVKNNKAVANAQSGLKTTNEKPSDRLAVNAAARFSSLTTRSSVQTKPSTTVTGRSSLPGLQPGGGTANSAAVVQPPATNSVPKEDVAKNNTPEQNAASAKTTVPDEQKPAVVENGNNASTSKDVTDTVKKSSNKQPLPKGPSHYFYLGLVASPDISFIHFQKTSTVGSGTGILLGYQFNKNLSVESGLLIDKKNYYTKGEYFDEKKVPYLVNNSISLVDVNGNCNMFEIPVNLRYTFKTKGKNTWYATAGMSSYLMGREYYDYNYKYPWNPEVYNGAYVYHSGTKDWFSIINLSAGYQRSIGSKTSIRIEPYIKLPAAGVGTGSLSIMSTGVYVGLTQRIP